MLFRTVRTLLSFACLAMGSPVAFAAADPSARDLEFFKKKVCPALAQTCFECHGTASKKVKGDLVLDSDEGLTSSPKVTSSRGQAKNPDISWFHC